MMKYLLALTVVALANAPAAASQDQKNGVKTHATAQQLYCVRFAQDTGSRLNREECRTKKEWALKGIDIDEVLKK
ncbi:hypothetical protein [Sphingomonas edaphi]|jgi:hypothetical protein|uniref:Uncharacterized protein n=1 Tax=Sphingomonas edaphi TaxID=2315689 RepID=A0A418Q2J1_9SPHN|nr:hypothetical protein [Sphingomonas edaphi]RIX32054.1 hypothetical protein D3M59_03485 [Sphingomonas edaphi]